MISIIICSIQKTLLEKCKLSIAKTIGIQFEIIVLDNHNDRLSINMKYNLGARLSKYNQLLFIHEDVEFITQNWGDKLLNILKNKVVGVVGVAGSTYLPSVPSGWYLPNEKYNNVYIHQGFKYKNSDIRFDNQGEDLSPVYLLDGVFLAMRKEVWVEFPFNEKLKGFHAYDVDVCQRISTKYQNLFTNQIEIIHYSEGKVDKIYFDTILKYKNAYLNYSYPKRDFKIEVELLKQFYLNIRCYYDKNESISKIKGYCSIWILGINGYFKIKKFLKNAR
jgi:hypothetical protein